MGRETAAARTDRALKAADRSDSQDRFVDAAQRLARAKVQQRLLAKQKLADGERSLLAEAAVSGLLYSGP
jgi:hypothetical protein